MPWNNHLDLSHVLHYEHGPEEKAAHVVHLNIYVQWLYLVLLICGYDGHRNKSALFIVFMAHNVSDQSPTPVGSN